MEELKMETVKEELGKDAKVEIAFRNRDSPCSLWEGEMKVKLEKENREILVPVQIFHNDDAKNGQKLFDWTTGKIFINYSLKRTRSWQAFGWQGLGRLSCRSGDS